MSIPRRIYITPKRLQNPDYHKEIDLILVLNYQNKVVVPKAYWKEIHQNLASYSEGNVRALLKCIILNRIEL